MHMASRGHMYGLHADCERQTTDHHHPKLCITWIHTGEGDGDHGGKYGTTICGNSPQTAFADIYRRVESLRLLRYRDMHGDPKHLWPWY